MNSDASVRVFVVRVFVAFGASASPMTPVAASRLRSPANANAHSGFSQLPTSLLSTLRELVFGGSVPLCIRLGEREQVSGDKVVEAYYVGRQGAC